MKKYLSSQENGIKVIDGSNVSFINKLESGITSDRIVRTKIYDDTILICTKYGLSIKNTMSQSVQNVYPRDIISESNVVVDACIDKNNRICLCTKKHLYYSYDWVSFFKRTISLISEDTEGNLVQISPNTFYSICRYNDSIYIATDKGLFVSSDDLISFNRILYNNFCDNNLIDYIYSNNDKLYCKTRNNTIYELYNEDKKVFLKLGRNDGKILINYISGEIVQNNKILLNWYKDYVYNTDIKYKIKRNGEIIKQEHDYNSYLDIGLDRGVTYTYEIEAIDKNGVLSNSNIVTISLTTPSYEQLPMLNSFTVTPIYVTNPDGVYVKLIWENTTEEIPTSAKVVITRNGVIIFENINPNVLELNDMGVDFNNNYVYQIYLKDYANNRPDSEKITRSIQL